MSQQDTLTLQIFLEQDLAVLINAFMFPWTFPEATQEKWRRYF